MELAAFKSVLKAGEGVSIEFKRCGNQPAADTFKTVCSFANRQGGSIYLGVLDDGSAEGGPQPHTVTRANITIAWPTPMFG